MWQAVLVENYHRLIKNSDESWTPTVYFLEVLSVWKVNWYKELDRAITSWMSTYSADQLKCSLKALPQSAKSIYNTDVLCDVTHLLQPAPMLCIEDMCLMCHFDSNNQCICNDYFSALNLYIYIFTKFLFRYTLFFVST